MDVDNDKSQHIPRRRISEYTAVRFVFLLIFFERDPDLTACSIYLVLKRFLNKVMSVKVKLCWLRVVTAKGH